MSTNAATWFYNEPEPNAFLITERLNATFWQARIIGMYWRTVNAEAPYRALGYAGETAMEMDWEPRHWLSLKVPAETEANGLPNGTKVPDLVEAISKRIIMIPLSVSYGDGQGGKIYEWHADGGKRRWSEIQGKPGYYQPKLHTKK